jgi:pyrroline-5-carboxylate reductase
MAIAEWIGVIGGNGWLGSALIRAALSSAIADPARMTVSSRSGHKGSIPDIGARWTQNHAELVKNSDDVVSSVRPFPFRDLDVAQRRKLVLSVMAGVGCETIADQTQAAAIRGSRRTRRRAKGRHVAQAFLQASGEAAEVIEESHIYYCAALTGSGAGVSRAPRRSDDRTRDIAGIPQNFAQKAARKVVSGASQLFAGASGDRGTIVKEMIDYKGIVAAALQAMLDGGFTEAVAAAAAKAATIAST